jgi:hypothetical protein
MYLPGGCICQAGEVLRTGGRKALPAAVTGSRSARKRSYMTNFNDAETTSLYVSAVAAPGAPN